MTPKVDMHALARRGAHETIKELVSQFGPGIIATPEPQKKASAPVTAVRTRKPMTAAQKREVSRRMKRYWASRRRTAKD